jgi:hypothetical protein
MLINSLFVYRFGTNCLFLVSLARCPVRSVTASDTRAVFPQVRDSNGAGETRQLERGNLEHYVTAQWFHDGKRVLISGNETGKGTRFYV